MMKKMRVSAGELANKALADSTDYNMLEIGHAMCECIPDELRKCIEKHRDIIDEDEYCIIRQKATDPLIHPLLRYKYLAWPYLPKPRPEQVVFLYNRKKDEVTKRLWTLPGPARMAQLATTSSCSVPDVYKNMQAWSIAFFKGTFWEYIRYEHRIDMPSEHEYFLQHREELIQAGCKIPDSSYSEPFDFDKINIEKVIDTKEALV